MLDKLKCTFFMQSNVVIMHANINTHCLILKKFRFYTGSDLYDLRKNSTRFNSVDVPDWLVGWLFWVPGPFETVFQSISGRLPKRGRIDESKNDQTTPTRTYCK